MTAGKGQRDKGWFSFVRAKVFAIAILIVLSAGNALAHKVSSVSLISRLEVEKGTYLLDAAMEVVPSDDDLLNDQIPPEEAARQFAEDFLVVMFDQIEESPELEISIETASDENTPEELQRKQVLVEMSGSIPASAKEFLLYLDPTCPMAVVMVVIKDDKPSRRMQVILPGEFSRPVNIQPIVEGDPFMETVEEEPPAEELAEPERSGSVIAAGFSAFWQVSLLPLALIASLFLLTTARKAVFIQIAALMIGLSLALALSAWGLISNRSWIVPATALLLVILSGESLFRHEFHVWRIFASFFAGAGIGIILASSTFFRLAVPTMGTVENSSLIGFVFGAELALILCGLVAASFFLTMGRFDWYRKTLVTPVAVLLVAFGIFKAVEMFL